MRFGINQGEAILRKKIWGLTAAGGVLFLLPNLLWARSTHIADEYPSIGRSTRALGMGNAFLTMPGKDEAALFYNPAALNDLPRDTKTVVNLPTPPAFEFNTRIIDTIRDIKRMAKDIRNASTKTAKVARFQDFVNVHTGEFNHIALKVPYVTVHRHNFGVGVIGDSRTTLSLRDQSTTSFEIRSVNDGGLAVGGAYGFLFDDLQVGLKVKFIERIELDRIVTSNDILINNDLGDVLGFSKWQKGFGVGADIGAKYTVPFTSLNPAVAVTYSDIGNTRFTSHPNDIPQTVHVGAGIHPKYGLFDSSWEVLLTEVNRRQDFLRRLHAGGEWRLPRFAATALSLRAGVNQGYPAGGLTLDWRTFKFVGAFYGEEVAELKKKKGNYRASGEFTLVF